MKHVGDKIQAFIAGELSGQQEQAVVDHLAGCPACAREVEQVRQLWDLLDEAALATALPAASAWPGIEARTFGRIGSSRLCGGGLWSKTGFAVSAVAAGLGLAILLPSENSETPILPDADEMAWGSSFWLDEQADSGLIEFWLATATDGSDS